MWTSGHIHANEGAAPSRPVFDTVIRRTPPAPPSVMPKAAPRAAPAAAARPSEASDGGTPIGTDVAVRPVDAVVVSAARIDIEGPRTRFLLTMSKGVRVEVFTLANPYRVVIDLPDVAFTLADGTGRTGSGLVTAFRYGLFADRKARIVLDAAGPVRIEKAVMTPNGGPPNGGGSAVELAITLAAISPEAFGSGTGAGLAPSGSGSASAARPQVYEDGAKPPSERPVVLIDPGHGGIDPGALGASNLLEKAVVLSVAQKVRRRLEATGRYDVRMTRTGDVFVSLDQRVMMSREMGADLFISLHADSIASKTYAPIVRGASVYTLSEQASDEQSQRMAEKENAADLLAGVDLGQSDDGDDVRDILIDLMKRETSNFSAEFSRQLTASMSKSIEMSRDPQRSAAFKVLRQTHAPSVLVELGFMSNAADETLMQQSEWQGKVAQSIVTAIESYFDRRTAIAP